MAIIFALCLELCEPRAVAVYKIQPMEGIPVGAACFFESRRYTTQLRRIPKIAHAKRAAPYSSCVRYSCIGRGFVKGVWYKG